MTTNYCCERLLYHWEGQSLNVANINYSGNFPSGKQMSQTVFVGPQLLHSEENTINANLSILITVLDNIKKNKVLPSHALASLVSHLPQLQHVNLSGTQADDLTLAR